MRRVVTLLVVVVACTSSHAQVPRPALARRLVAPLYPCALAALVVDPDPCGTNVRTGPGRQFPVLATLPPPPHDAVGDLVEVAITGATARWMRITQGLIDTVRGRQEVFSGTGWVAVGLLAIDTRSGMTLDDGTYKRVETWPLYREPKSAAAAVGTVPSGTRLQLVGCHEGWAQVAHAGRSGWIPPEARDTYKVGHATP